MAGAPSAQTLVQFSHLSPAFSRCSDVTQKFSSPIGFSGNALQKRKFSLIVPLSTKRELAKSWTCQLISADSSSCNTILFTGTNLFQNHTFNVCRHDTNTSEIRCVIQERDFGYFFSRFMSEHLMYNGFAGGKYLCHSVKHFWHCYKFGDVVARYKGSFI